MPEIEKPMPIGEPDEGFDEDQEDSDSDEDEDEDEDDDEDDEAEGSYDSGAD